MQWEKLKEVEQVGALAEESKQQPVIIFKHSTSCSISATAKTRRSRGSKLDADQGSILGAD